MKRALAERAKQQKNEQQAARVGINVTTMSSSHNSQNHHSLSFTQQPLHHTPQQQQEQSQENNFRIPKNASPRPPATTAATTKSMTPPTKTNSTNNPKKRIRLSSSSASATTTTPNDNSRSRSRTTNNLSPLLVPSTFHSSFIKPPNVLLSAAGASEQQQQEEDEEDETNAQTNTKFYLKYQNQALASELYNYKFSIDILEKERKKRREECKLVYDMMSNMIGVWNSMEVVLFESLKKKMGDDTNMDIDMEYSPGGKSNLTNLIKQSKKASSSSLSPPSTGNGTDVENIYNVMESMIQLANLSNSLFQQEEDLEQNGIKQEEEGGHDANDDGMSNTTNIRDVLVQDYKREKEFLKIFSETTTSFSKRMNNLQGLVLNIIQHSLIDKSHTDQNSTKTQNASAMNEVINLGQVTEQITILQNNIIELESKMGDLAKDRDTAKESEKRVRRGLYRVATGRMNITEVLMAIEESSSLNIEDLEELQKDFLSLSSPKGMKSNIKGGSSKSDAVNTSDRGQGGTSMTSTSGSFAESTAIVIDGKELGVDDVVQMKKKIDDLQLINNSRDKKITELMTDKEEQDKKINSILHKGNADSVDDDSIKSSKLFIEASTRLEVTQRDNKDLKNQLESVMERWKVTKSDLELFRNKIDELSETHCQRMKELSGESIDGIDNEDGDHQEYAQSVKIVQLEHKLKHALDSVRQAEKMKSSLMDTSAMNETLQRQLNELMTKNTQLAVSNAATRETSSVSPSSLDISPNRSTDGKDDKLYRLKREYSASMVSKERAEKERDSLIAMNVRLQQQSVEKDDMNAKSLSTILHLKQLSEQLEQEKSLLEKKLKSANQLAVMTRLTANAKEKVEREAMAQKELAEEAERRTKSEMEALLREKDVLLEELSINKSQVEKSNSELNKLKHRCDDLVSNSTVNQQQIMKLSEDLEVVKKDAIEAVRKAALAKTHMSSGSSNKFNSEFTAEQLTIQVNALKSRISCPVCNTRDKKVIITRCRHMFCRQCVELNLESRNRKCPSCGLRFDRKDVEDVWF